MGRETMKGVGGPLLCIGDLLSDLAEESPALDHHQPNKESATSSSFSDLNSDALLQSLDLSKRFQENYTQLNEALAGTDHSWTALTLKLCTALATANKLVQSANSNARSLSAKVGELEEIVTRGDSVVAAANSILVSLNQTGGSFDGSQST